MAQTLTYRQKPHFPTFTVIVGGAIFVFSSGIFLLAFLYVEGQKFSAELNLLKVVIALALTCMLVAFIAVMVTFFGWVSQRRHFKANQGYSPWAQPIDPSLGQGGRVWSPY